MIELDQALKILQEVPGNIRVQSVGLEDALGRVLAHEVLSPIDSPPFDKSAMDGFAVAAGNDSSEYRILDTIAAGNAPLREVGRGECARIMTGAMLPPGAGRVIRRELVEEKDGIIRLLKPEKGDNVIRKGENMKAGRPLLPPKILFPQDIGILAAAGIPRIDAAVPPATGIVSTGPEIRAPGEPLDPGQIYDSNGPQLSSQLSAMHCPCGFFARVDDERGQLSAVIAKALAACEVVLLTGGVSMGDFDYVPECLQDLGAQILFHGVAVKPGKPTLFARRGNKYVFGLPGNPVSTFVIFEVFVKPFLYRRMGIQWAPRAARARLAETIRRRDAGRTEFLPVRVREGMAEPVAFHGSSHLNALAEADGLIQVPRGVTEIVGGTEIDVRPL